MTGYDPQPAEGLLHICADPIADQVARQAAAQAGLSHRRFPDAFAAAAYLLGHPPGRAILLVSADSLAPVERALFGWAGHRWPGLEIWIHGGSATAQIAPDGPPIRRVELAKLAAALGNGRPNRAPAPPPPTPAAPVRQPTGPAAPPAPPPPQPTGATNAEPSLRLHQPRPVELGDSLLTEEELAALLAGEEDMDVPL